MAATEQHDIVIKNKKQIEVTGVASVESFDVSEFSLVTSGGPLSIRGSNLHMKHLDLETGMVIIEGTIGSLTYVSEQSKRKKLGGRLFR
jgi:sporulation protein YabP